MNIQKVIRKVTYPGIKKDLYGVCNDGAILNLVTGKILKPYLDDKGYYSVTPVRTNGKWPAIGVHRLVAWEFCPNDDPEHKIFVDHLDGVKTNNAAYNLEWVTPAENTHRAQKIGLMLQTGEINKNNIYPESFIRELCERLESGQSRMDIIRDLNPDHPYMKDNTSLYDTLSNLMKKKIWKDIVSNYNFPKEKYRYTARVPETGKYVYPESLIRKICEELNSGKNVRQIALTLQNEISRYSKSKDTYRNAYSVVKDIADGNTWVNISSEYENIRKNYPSVDCSNLNVALICDMHDKGYKNREICKILGLKKEDDRVKYIVNQYRYNHLIPDNMDIPCIN